MGKTHRKIKELFGLLFSRLVLTVALLLAQVVWLFLLISRLSDYRGIFGAGGVALSVLMCIALIRKDTTAPEFKISWVLVFMVMPIQGGLLYLLWGDKRPAIPLRRRLERAQSVLAPLRRGDPAAQAALEAANPRAAQTAR